MLFLLGLALFLHPRCFCLAYKSTKVISVIFNTSRCTCSIVQGVGHVAIMHELCMYLSNHTIIVPYKPIHIVCLTILQKFCILEKLQFSEMNSVSWKFCVNQCRDHRINVRRGNMRTDRFSALCGLLGSALNLAVW